MLQKALDDVVMLKTDTPHAARRLQNVIEGLKNVIGKAEKYLAFSESLREVYNRATNIIEMAVHSTIFLC